MRVSLLAAAAALCLTACGGGGGGGGSTAVDPNQTPVPSTFQAANTSVVYQAASAAASFTATSGVTSSGIASEGAGSTVTVTTDSSDHISNLAINVSTAGTAFSAAYAGTQIAPILTPITLSQLSTVIQQISVGGTAFGFQGSGQGLSYSAFGIWESVDTPTAGRIGVMASGNETAATPISGTATFTGSTMGVGASGTTSFALTGTAQVTANFGVNAVTTTFSGLTVQNLSTNALGTLATQSGSGTIAGNKYTTVISGGGLSGTAAGTFYGPIAQETAGVWRSTGGGISFIGSYGAHQ